MLLALYGREVSRAEPWRGGWCIFLCPPSPPRPSSSEVCELSVASPDSAPIVSRLDFSFLCVILNSPCRLVFRCTYCSFCMSHFFSCSIYLLPIRFSCVHLVKLASGLARSGKLPGPPPSRVFCSFPILVKFLLYLSCRNIIICLHIYVPY